jgi:hypothetical protein
MAQRRLLSLRIVDSARFLQMPLTAHAPYFPLALHADDDGVVESFPVMRTTGAAQDDLKILLAKKFIRQLNDDLVVFVTDWREHNFIRADRKTDSVYKELLLQVVPEANVIEPKPRTDVKDNSRSVNQQPSLRPLDRPRTVHGRHRLGKVRLNNVNSTKEEREEGDEPKTALHRLPNLEQALKETALIADDILAALGDQHSQPFYALVAAKTPASVIRQKLAEIKQGGAHSPAKVFTGAMKAYATAMLQKQKMSSLISPRKDLFRI